MRCEDSRAEIQRDFLAKGNGNYTVELKNHLVSCRKCRAHGVKLGRILQSVQLEPIIPLSERVIAELAADLSQRKAPKEQQKKRVSPWLIGVGLGLAILIFIFFPRGNKNATEDVAEGEIQNQENGDVPLAFPGDPNFVPKTGRKRSTPSPASNTAEELDRFAKISENLQKDLKTKNHPQDQMQNLPAEDSGPTTPANSTAVKTPTTTAVPQKTSSSANGVLPQKTPNATAKTKARIKPAAKITTVKLATTPQPSTTPPLPRLKYVQSPPTDHPMVLQPDFLKNLKKLKADKSKSIADNELNLITENENAEPLDRILLPGLKQTNTDGEDLEDLAETEEMEPAEDELEIAAEETVPPCEGGAEPKLFDAEFANHELLSALGELAQNRPETLSATGLPLEMQQSLLTGETNTLRDAMTAAGPGALLYGPEDIYKLLGVPPPAPGGTRLSRSAMGARDPRPYSLAAGMGSGSANPGGTPLGPQARRGFTGLQGRLTDGTVLTSNPSSSSEEIAPLPTESDGGYGFDSCPVPSQNIISELTDS